MKTSNPKIGDCFEISLDGGRFAYSRLLFEHKEYGALIEVFDILSAVRVGTEILTDAKQMFPPVFVTLKPAILKGGWSKIGNLPVNDFVFPKFRFALGMKPGTHDNWVTWEGSQNTKVGKLPVELRSLEIIMIWGYKMLEDRILDDGVSPMKESFL